MSHIYESQFFKRSDPTLHVQFRIILSVREFSGRFGEFWGVFGSFWGVSIREFFRQ